MSNRSTSTRARAARRAVKSTFACAAARPTISRPHPRKSRTCWGRFPGVSSVEDDLPYGKQELILEVTPRGQALGFTTQSAGLQVRNAFQGAIAQRFARGDEEVEIKVRYPRRSADRASFLNLFLRAPDGAEVPLSEVVTLRQERGFSRLRREDGAREVAITGEIDETVASLGALLPAIVDGGLGDIASRYGLSYRFKGKAEEQSESAADMGAGAIVGLLAIYIVLAWVFANFSRPIIVMAIIPFGFVGAVLGHLALGFDLTILSVFGLLGLAGILVNNSIILVRTVDDHIKDEAPLREAIVAACRDRLRPVLLTLADDDRGPVPADVRAQLPGPVPGPDGDHDRVRARGRDPDRAGPHSRPARHRRGYPGNLPAPSAPTGPGAGYRLTRDRTDRRFACVSSRTASERPPQHARAVFRVPDVGQSLLKKPIIERPEFDVFADRYVVGPSTDCRVGNNGRVGHTISREMRCHRIQRAPPAVRNGRGGWAMRSWR